MSQTLEETEEPGLYGVMAEFGAVEKLLHAARQARDAGYKRMEAYTPFPIEELTEALGKPHTRLQNLVLFCGAMGGLCGFMMQYYLCVVDYPMNIAGRPLNSWPMFVPVTYELTILCAAFGAFLGMLISNGLPMPYHPVFNVPQFSRAQIDRFFLCIEADDPKFDATVTKQFLQDLGALSVSEAPL